MQNYYGYPGYGNYEQQQQQQPTQEQQQQQPPPAQEQQQPPPPQQVGHRQSPLLNKSYYPFIVEIRKLTVKNLTILN
jgi:FtsZ-interacting cell division protein YlmF